MAPINRSKQAKSIALTSKPKNIKFLSTTDFDSPDSNTITLTKPIIINTNQGHDGQE